MFAEEQKKGPLQAGRAGDFLCKASPQRGITQVIPDLPAGSLGIVFVMLPPRRNHAVIPISLQENEAVTKMDVIGFFLLETGVLAKFFVVANSFRIVIFKNYICIGVVLFTLKSVDRSYQTNPGGNSDFQVIKWSEKFVITERTQYIYIPGL